MASESVGSSAPPSSSRWGEGRIIGSDETTAERERKDRWFSAGVHVGALGPSDHAAGGQDYPELACPCGAGPCSMLLSRTERNPNRWFYRCPLKSPGKQCKFFKWCDTDAAGVVQVTPDQLGGFKSPMKACDKYFPNSPVKHIGSYDVKSPVKLDQRPVCSCGAGRCNILTKNDGDDAGRSYFACLIKKGQGACKFFQWLDSPAKPHETKINHVHEISLPNFEVLSKKTEATATMKDGAAIAEGGIQLQGVLDAADQHASPLLEGKELRANYVAGPSAMRRLNFVSSSRAASNLGNCFTCGQGGHWMRECPQSRMSTCFKCGKIGHWKKDCTA